MTIHRLKFAWARGARIQVDQRLEVVEVWSDREPHWGPICDYRIHPDDADLEYGPLSSALRRKVFGLPDQLSAEAVWIASTLFDDPTLPHFYSLDDDIMDFFHLFVVELLADEGL